MASKRKPFFEIYPDRRGLQAKGAEWRWRLVATNGKILADSGESYDRESSCIAAVHRVQLVANSADTKFAENNDR